MSQAHLRWESSLVELATNCMEILCWVCLSFLVLHQKHEVPFRLAREVFIGHKKAHVPRSLAKSIISKCKNAGGHTPHPKKDLLGHSWPCNHCSTVQSHSIKHRTTGTKASNIHLKTQGLNQWPGESVHLSLLTKRVILPFKIPSFSCSRHLYRFCFVFISIVWANRPTGPQMLHFPVNLGRHTVIQQHFLFFAGFATLLMFSLERITAGNKWTLQTGSIALVLRCYRKQASSTWKITSPEHQIYLYHVSGQAFTQRFKSQGSWKPLLEVEDSRKPVFAYADNFKRKGAPDMLLMEIDNVGLPVLPSPI